MKKRIVAACLLMGCTTNTPSYTPPVPPLVSPPDPKTFYIQGSSDILNTTILYRESVLAYSQYLISYADRLNSELGIPKPADDPVVVDDTCKLLIDNFPALKIPNPPDVEGYTNEEIVSALITYIEDITARSEAYKEAIEFRKAELASKC
jgi:hypothetical protein